MHDRDRSAVVWRAVQFERTNARRVEHEGQPQRLSASAVEPRREEKHLSVLGSQVVKLCMVTTDTTTCRKRRSGLMHTLVHPHPRITKSGVFFASFGLSRISLTRGFLKCPVLRAKRQVKFSDPFLAKDSSRKFGNSRDGDSRMGVYSAGENLWGLREPTPLPQNNTYGGMCILKDEHMSDDE